MRPYLKAVAQLGQEALERKSLSLIRRVPRTITPAAAITAQGCGHPCPPLALFSSLSHEGLGFRRHATAPSNLEFKLASSAAAAADGNSSRVPEGSAFFHGQSPDLPSPSTNNGGSTIMQQSAAGSLNVSGSCDRSFDTTGKASSRVDLYLNLSMRAGRGTLRFFDHGTSTMKVAGASPLLRYFSSSSSSVSLGSFVKEHVAVSGLQQAQLHRLGSAAGVRFQSSSERNAKDLLSTFRRKRDKMEAKEESRQRAREQAATQAVPQSQEGFTADQPVQEYGPPTPLTQPLTGELQPTCKEEERMASLLARPDLVVTRSIEWQNIFLGFEQQNRYEIRDPRAPTHPVGYILEESNWILRQILRTHRPFRASVQDYAGREICQVWRPFFLINSVIYVECEGKVVGEAVRRWHLWKRLYDAYVGTKQFAEVRNWGFWDWTFTLQDEDGGVLAVIDRNFRGLGLEVFTDAGQYVVRFGDVMPHPKPDSPAAAASPLQAPDTADLTWTTSPQGLPSLEVARPLTLTERIITLALAVSLDNDYFSRMSGRGGMWIPFGIAAEDAI